MNGVFLFVDEFTRELTDQGWINKLERNVDDKKVAWWQSIDSMAIVYQLTHSRI